MSRFLFFLLFVYISGNSYAQRADLDEVSGFYVCPRIKEYTEQDFVVSGYSFYDKSTYKEMDGIAQQPLLDYQLIRYGKNTPRGRNNVLSINVGDTLDWDRNKIYIAHSLPYVAGKENLSDLSGICMKIPVDLDLAITLELKKKIKQKRMKKTKDGDEAALQEIDFMKEKIRSSYLCDDMNSILGKHKLVVADIEITEPMLATSKKAFIRLYPQYANCKLPKKIIGVYVIFILKTIL